MNEDQIEKLLETLENISASMSVLELCADAIMAAMPEDEEGGEKYEKYRTLRVVDVYQRHET